MNNENPIVYSTEFGRICPECGRPKDKCVCKTNNLPVKTGEKHIRIWRETKGRKGKTVTLVVGLPLNETGLKDMLSDLKRQCGSGGSVKEGVLEIQGDHREAILTVLKKKGFNPKLAGG